MMITTLSRYSNSYENFIYANDFNVTIEKPKLKGFINKFSSKI